MVGSSKNKNTDNQGKGSCANESDQISLLRDSTVSSAHFCFYLFYCSAKEKDNIRRKNN